MLWERMVTDDARFVVHRSRYLHWGVEAVRSGAHLKINGNTVATATATSGYVDLIGTALTPNEVYEVVWTDDSLVVGSHLYESPSTTGTLVLPSTPPTFTSGADEDQLNAISTDTQYLLDNGILVPNLAFVSKISVGNRPSYTYYYTGLHLQRYLYISGTCRHGGEIGDDDIFIKVSINSTEVFYLHVDGTVANGGRFAYFNTFVDLEGTDHYVGGYVVSTGTGPAGSVSIANGSSLGLSHAEEYICNFRIESDTQSSEVQIYQLAEYPAQWIL
jgi:hypothetical protein